jgi:hypothetical protein
LQDYPIEQYIRDAKIDTLYEGTTAIQGLDFFFRKMVRDQFQRDHHLAGEITETNAIVGHMINDLMSADASNGGELRNIYKVGLNTTRLLMVLGDVVCAWLLLRQAEVALDKLGGDVSAKDKTFYEGKVMAAQFFAQHFLPKLTAERRIAESIDLSLMDLDEASF